MSNKVIYPQQEISKFLHELIEVLNSPSFDKNIDLDILMRKKGESPTDPFTTVNTLLELGFDNNDIWEELISLTLSNYMETIIDDLDPLRPPFHAFVKNIQNREVYIKVKIRDKAKGKVFCVSFHFARYPITKVLPYK